MSEKTPYRFVFEFRCVDNYGDERVIPIEAAYLDEALQVFYAIKAGLQAGGEDINFYHVDMKRGLTDASPN